MAREAEEFQINSPPELQVEQLGISVGSAVRKLHDVLFGVERRQGIRCNTEVTV
jgi:hypothetical protein